ncbi:hypothetical protein M409DRAFT_63345 [Zasmidium cellare ATCC 36951]|uniref:Zn(2)-C6 fungal-type domain-containing protein n=1 Tax=Zasmidium cellare ATCC 36951 TaxID=1080233 RepID=A0A6A6CYE5_ZASCE|nr:uncharacterized protein M409DRAFT_63345 [Zasmidium cellare ATCC 36951]KAF2171743.1 hypothetical protein M409DRAFT_63345 [Zasmidium cellare ATCC 36951]
MTTTQPPQQQQQQPPRLFTCVTCARRKVKCDKTGPPCSTCKKARQECYYQEPPPRKRKRKPVDELQERVDKYEKLLKQNGILPPSDLENSPSEASPGTGTATDKSSATVKPKKSTGTLLKGAGKTRYIDSNIWRTLGEDLHPSSDEEDNYEQQAPVTTTVEAVDPVSAAFLGQSAHCPSLLDLHPTYDIAMKLWKQYLKNIDPIVKIVHVPTTLEMLQRSSANPSTMSKVNECLLFSIYHFAISASSEKECVALFGPQWRYMKKTYHDATRQALVGVHFLRTTELAVLQAYMLLLLSMRNDYDPHTFWILTGIAVRIAQRMGLHRDGEELGLNPFDVQMRRRVFWQLLPLDGLSGQLSGTGIAIAADSWDTKQPLNLEDEDIWPGMETPPVERKGATSMIFILARTEIGRFHQKIRPALGPNNGNWGVVWDARDIPEIQEALRDLENMLEEKYVRYCDISIPIQVLCIAMARGAINSARLRIRRPRGKTSEGISIEERKELYAMAEKVLGHDLAVQQNASLDRFNWHMRQFFQWDPLITMLQEARQLDCVIEPEALWSKVELVYSVHPELFVQKRSIDIALNRLTIKSWDAMQANNLYPTPEPAFVTSLREAITRREASRQNTETPKQSVNVFDPSLDASSDMPAANYINYNPVLGYNNMNLGPMENMNADIDWLFWDQMLMQNPEPLPMP